MTADPERDDDATPAPMPDPAKRARRPDPAGVEIKVGERAWKLAELGLARMLNDARDTLYDDMTIHRDVGMREIKTCAWAMLQANYDLGPAEAIAVMEGADRDELIEAVLRGVFVHRYDDADRGYTSWARSALLANGIDPAKLAKADQPHVLRQLVETGRAIPLGRFTAAAEFATTRAELLGEV